MPQYRREWRGTARSVQVSPCQSVSYSDWVTCLTPPRAGAPYITGRLLPGRRKALHMLRSEEHTSELQSPCNLVCRLLLEKKNNKIITRLHLRSSLLCSDDLTYLLLITYDARP